MRNEKGLTLIEVLIALLISTIVIAAIFLAFNTGFTLFLRGTRNLEETMETRILFRKLEDDLRYLSRVEELSLDEGEEMIKFNLCDKKVISTEETTYDKVMEGWTISYTSELAADEQGRDIVILYKKIDKFKWKDKFGCDRDNNGKDEIPATEYMENAVGQGADEKFDIKNFDDDGLPDDLVDSKYDEEEGDFKPVEELKDKLTSVKFVLFDHKGKEIKDISGKGLSKEQKYKLYRKPRTVEIIVEYRTKYTTSGVRKITHIVNLRNPSMVTQ